MAVYMSAARQRRRIVIIAVAALVVGLIAGLVLGRATASDDDPVASAQSEARSLVAALRALPIEYEQGQSGGESKLVITDAIDRVNQQASTLVAESPWLGTTQKKLVTDAVGGLVKAAEANAPPTQFADLVEHVAALVEDAFAISD